jgi:hypothetical protein
MGAATSIVPSEGAIRCFNIHKIEGLYGVVEVERVLVKSMYTSFFFFEERGDKVKVFSKNPMVIGS